MLNKTFGVGSCRDGKTSEIIDFWFKHQWIKKANAYPDEELLLSALTNSRNKYQIKYTLTNSGWFLSGWEN
ncbi:MAG: hypothetical protein C0595_07610 [Marinilabiliales bacterium]|nr:MAG: hypothetical protein C0595_07610 [Marinilabiliales bacterium]